MIMNKKLLIGINVVIIGLVIAAAIYNPRWIPVLLVGVAPIVVWIYLVWMVRKKKTKIFHDQMEPELAERRLKILKIFLRVGGISFVVFIISVVGHNAVSAVSETEEAVFFAIALLSIVPFAVGTIGGLVTFLIGRRKIT
jgi:hypothetical protein